MVRLKKENQYLGKAERKTYFMQKKSMRPYLGKAEHKTYLMQKKKKKARDLKVFMSKN